MVKFILQEYLTVLIWRSLDDQPPLLNVLTMEFKYLLAADFGLVLFDFFLSTLSPFCPEVFCLRLQIQRHFCSQIISYV